MAMLLVLLILGLLTMSLSLLGVFTKPGEPKSATTLYLWITLSTVLLVAVEYGLSRSRYYALAAWLAVSTILTATFMTAIISPDDNQFLFFLVLGGLLGSLFLSASATALIFLITFMGLLLLPAFIPQLSTANDLNALVFVLTVGGMVVMAAFLRKRYLDQLVESQAELRELSIRDPLTSLFNRRRGWELLEDEIIRSDRYQRDLCVIMLDIDNFKTINDTQGHLAGDLVLKTVAKVAGETVRSIDHLFRWGGEEFLVVLPDTELEAALHAAERLREAIARTAIQLPYRELNVTASFGVTRKDENTPDLETLLARADQAMYIAKYLGRDRVASSK